MTVVYKEDEVNYGNKIIPKKSTGGPELLFRADRAIVIKDETFLIIKDKKLGLEGEYTLSDLPYFLAS